MAWSGTDAALILVVLVAACLDLFTGRIPNLLTVPVLILAPLLTFSPSAAAWRFLAVVVVFAVGYFAFALGALGGGDIKLLASVAALKGGFFLFNALPWILLTGAVTAAVLLARKRLLWPLFKRMGQGALETAAFGAPVGVIVSEHQDHFPFGIAIAVGVLVTLYGESLGITITNLVRA